MSKIPFMVQLVSAGASRLALYFTNLQRVGGELQTSKSCDVLKCTGLQAGVALAYLLHKAHHNRSFCLKLNDDGADENSLENFKIEPLSYLSPPTPKITDPAEIKKMVKMTADSYKHAISSIQAYKEKILVVMEKCIKNEPTIGTALWTELKNANKNRIEAEKRLAESLKLFDPCVGSEEVRNNITGLRKQYEAVKGSAQVATKFWTQVMETRRQFRDELEAVFPHVDITAEELNFRGGKKEDLLNIIIEQILLYQMMLSELQCELHTTVERALTGSKEDIMNAKMDLCIAKERRKWAKTHQKKMMIAKVGSDREMNEKLAQQAQVHRMKIKDTVDAHIEKVIQEERKLNDERTTAEKTAESLKLASMLGRLQAVDTELKARMESDKSIKQAQLLWAACEALEGVLNGKTDHRMKVSVDKELDAISIAAGPKDNVVKCILDGICKIKRDGVLSEKALVERYRQVEKVCRNMAQIPEQGANLFGIILSQIQSFLTRTPSPVPCELTEPPKNTFEILERVRFYVDRRDWYQAFRYIKMLEGLPKRVSHEWTVELQHHIEAKQASAALITHAYSKLRSG